MQRNELADAFINAVVKNDLVSEDGNEIRIPANSPFFDDFYNEIVNSKERKEKKRYYFNYIRKVMRDEDWYINEGKVLDFVNDYVHDDVDFETVKMELSVSNNWSNFWKRVEDRFGIEDY